MCFSKLFNYIRYFCFFILVAYWSPTVASTTIRLGVSNAQSGHSSQLGIDLNLGAEIYFDAINQQGGINGQKIELVKMDDGYEPLNTVNNTKKLLKQNVLALFNYVGTPTTKAILPLLNQDNSLFITPFTGADFLRDSLQTNIFNIRASYEQEAQAQVKYLVNKAAVKSFAIVIQADAFGLALEKYYHSALNVYGLKAEKTLRYRRNTLDILHVATYLKESAVEAIFFVGTYAPFAELIKVNAENNYTPIYSGVSFVSSYSLYSELKNRQSQHSRVLITEVVPNPLNCQSDICHQFREAANKHSIRSPNQVHFEGYLNAKFVTDAIKKCSTPVVKSCLSNEMRKLQVDYIGKNINPMSQASEQAIKQVFYTTFNIQ